MKIQMLVGVDYAGGNCRDIINVRSLISEIGGAGQRKENLGGKEWETPPWRNRDFCVIGLLWCRQSLWVLEVGIREERGVWECFVGKPMCFREKGLQGLSQGFSGWDEHKKLLNP